MARRTVTTKAATSVRPLMSDLPLQAKIEHCAVCEHRNQAQQLARQPMTFAAFMPDGSSFRNRGKANVRHKDAAALGALP